MKLIVGLGNFGKEYEHSRHNMGFDVADKFVESLGDDISLKGFNSLYQKVKYFDEVIYVIKPMTYMNNSGIAVSEIMNYFKIDVNDLIVIYDDMDIEVGHIKLKENGRSAGHNGIKSIINYLKTENFKRIKIGIGQPTIDTINFVLGKPKGEELESLIKAQNDAVDALKIALKESFNKAMSLYNKK